MPNEYEKALSVISKSPEKRYDHEIHQLVPWIRSKAKLFKGLKTDILADIIRNCRYQTKTRDEIIIKQGDIGDCFYITLNGKVTIYILNKDQMGDNSVDPDDDDGDIGNIIHYDEDGKLDRARLGNFVCSLEGGAPFGDVALTSGDSIRTASILADERTDLLVVDRALYNRSMKDVLAKEFLEKTTFIKTNPLFANWPAKYRKQLAMALYKESFGYESTLTRQGDNTSDMYFILRGQVEIQMDANHHPQQYPQIFRAAKENVVDKLVRKVEQQQIRHRERELRHQPKGSNTNIKRRENVKCTRLCHLGVNESVGDIELTMSLPTYVQTAVCRETTEVLVLEAKHYDRLFVRRHPRTIEAMRDQIGFKLNFRLSMQRQKSEIPFLGYLQTIIDSRHKPVPLSDHKDEPSVSEAEKEFLNHKGPLIDLHGPGSVFYLIKLREQVRMRMRAKRGERMERQFRTTRSLPHSVLMAAARQINGLPEDGPAHLRPISARVPYPNPPMSFRSIQSARERRELEEKEKEKEREMEREKEREREEQESKEETAREEHEERRDGGGGGGGGGEEEEEETDPLQSYRSRSLESPDGEGPEEHDAHLSFLEEKVRCWLMEDNPKWKPQVAQLRRLPVQDMEFQPRPGNKIYVRKRERTLHSQTSTSHSSSGKSQAKGGHSRLSAPTLTSTGMKANDKTSAYKILLSQ